MFSAFYKQVPNACPLLNSFTMRCCGSREGVCTFQGRNDGILGTRMISFSNIVLY